MNKKDPHFSLDSSSLARPAEAIRTGLPARQVGDREREGAIYSSPVKDASFNSSPFPKQLQTVKVNGDVLYSMTTRYNANRGFKYYISQGGRANKSLKRLSYVIYANGSVRSTRKIFLFNNCPRIESGSGLFVSKKDVAQNLSAQELLGLTTGIASLGAIILGVFSLSK